MSGNQVYVLLGTVESSRERIVRDLSESLSPEENNPVFWMVAATDPEKDLFRQAVEDLSGKGCSLGEWHWEGDGLNVPGVPEKATIFLLANSLEDPLNLLEQWPEIMGQNGWSLARILTAVNCRLLHDKPALRPWFGACIHFSDYVFLANREGVPDKWIREYQEHFRKECYPCHFELLRKKGVKNAALVLEPEPRRISHYFDEEGEGEDSDFHEDLPDVEITIDGDEVPEEAEDSEDPYFRKLVAGRREIILPDIRKYLPE